MLAEEIVPVPAPSQKEEVTSVKDDEHPRRDTTLRALQKAKADRKSNWNSDRRNGFRN